MLRQLQGGAFGPGPKGREALFFCLVCLKKQKYHPRGKKLLIQFDGCVNCFQVRRLENDGRRILVVMGQLQVRTRET